MANHITKQLDRSLGLSSVYSIAVGAMMGSGIFVLPGLAAAIAGPWVALSYMLAGFLVIPALFSKAELATAMPVAGGTFVYVQRSMGPWMGTVVGLGTWFALTAKTAFALVGLGGYLILFSEAPPLLVSLTILTAIVTINIIGAGKASTIQRWVVYLCLAALTVYITAGWPVPFLDSDLFTSPDWGSPNLPTGFAGIITAAGFVFVSYNGVTKVCSVAEEIRNPERNIPLGMLLAQASMMVLYTLVSLVITTNVPYDSLSSDLAPIATAALAIGGPKAQTAMAVVAVLALSSMCNAGVMASARFPFAMSRAGSLPAPLSAISKRFGTPVLALIVTGLLLVVLITLLPVAKLAKLASGFTIFIFCVVNLAVIVLRESGARWYRPSFRSPLYPWTQCLGIMGGVWLLLNLGLIAISGVGLSLIIGSGWYFFYVRKRIDRVSAFNHLWGEAHSLKATEAAEAEEEKEHTKRKVIVPVFGGEPAPSRLIRLASAFVEHDGSTALEVLRLEEVPDQAHLAFFLEADEATQLLAQRAAQIGRQSHVEVEFHDIVTHNAKHALLHHATVTNADWIIMEWPTRSELHYFIRHPFAWWMNNPPCDLAIFLDRAGAFDGDTQDDFQRILVLAEPGPYDSLLVHVADCLAANQKDGRVTLFWPISDDAGPNEVDQSRQYHDQLGSLCASPCDSRIVRGSDPLATIATVSADYDLLIIGAPAERTLRTLFRGSRKHRAAEASQCSVLKLKAPRHQVHHRFAPHREDTQEKMILAPYIHHAVVGHRLQVSKKVDLFKLVGTMVQAAGACNNPTGITTALFDRERQQNTALREGVALSAPTVETLRHTQVVVLTLDRAIDYQSSGRPMVDVVLLVLAPRADRQSQLWVLERLARMALRSDLLQHLREAEDEDAIRAAILTVLCEKKI